MFLSRSTERQAGHDVVIDRFLKKNFLNLKAI